MIPNQLHFIHLGRTGRQWELHHYLAVKSAFLRGGFDRIVVWVDEEPSGKWWTLSRNMFKLKYVTPPTEIFNIPITEPAHQSDVLRLEILLREGGVYADTDVIFLKPFTDLLSNKVVMGEQGVNPVEGLCNAIVASEPNTRFLKDWLVGFEHTFKGGDVNSSTWCTHSVHYAYKLSKQIPEELTVLGPRAFFWPLYTKQGLTQLYETNIDISESYVLHLWESSAKGYLNNIELDRVNSMNTTFSNSIKDLI